MTQDLERAYQDFRNSAQQTTQKVTSTVTNLVNPQPQQSGFAKAASEAIEYIREALKPVTKMASDAFDGAVKMGSEAIDSINNNNRNGPRGR